MAAWRDVISEMSRISGKEDDEIKKKMKKSNLEFGKTCRRSSKEDKSVEEEQTSFSPLPLNLSQGWQAAGRMGGSGAWVGVVDQGLYRKNSPAKISFRLRKYSATCHPRLDIVYCERSRSQAILPDNWVFFVAAALPFISSCRISLRGEGREGEGRFWKKRNQRGD
jgi:hypothetical protein